jgi:single-strand DNA-binding protein
MNGINKVILVGTLGKDPEVRTLGSGQSVANFTMATTEKWKDKQSSEMQEKTSWHRVKAWGKLAEIISQYLHKGSQVYIEGKLDYGKYEKDGVTHYTTDVLAQSMQMLGGKPSGESEFARKVEAEHKADAKKDFTDDDIPF